MSYYRKYKYISANGHTPATNIAVGSLTYSIIYGIILLISYLIWGFDVFDKIWLTLIGAVSFPLVKFTLRDIIGFWVY